MYGFKSFAVKTVIDFLPQCAIDHQKACGITAIVGPNGSGKSNVADAIRWVMGEQSPKSLRGKKTHDVIFAGSHGKSPLNFAEVSLVFDNSDKHIPVDFPEVTVTRKVFRSGEGEYRINGSKVRLLDVVDILAKAGIGKESHCVLTQGMSDATLNANPLERRSIIEEAAGVKPHQIKKERSLKKLRTTEDNLQHARELIVEIEPRLRILKRQAKKAEQRIDIEKDLLTYQTIYYTYTWNEMVKKKEIAEQAVSLLGREVMVAQQRLDRLQDTRRNKSAKIQDDSERTKLEQELREKRQDISHVEREIALIEGKLEIEKQQQKTQKQIDIIPVDLAFVRSRVEDLQTLQKAFLYKLAEVKDLTQLQSIRKEAENLAKKLENLYEDSGKRTVEVARKSDVLEKEQKAFQDRIDALENQKESLAKKRTDKQSVISTIESAITNLAKDTKTLNEEFFQVERDIMTRQKEFSTLKDRHNDAKVEFARVEVRAEDLKTEIQREMKIDPQTLVKDTFEKIDTTQYETKIIRCKTQLSHIGGIDPLVAEEYAETQERYDFLTKGVMDMEETIVSLEKVIKEMDMRIAKEFTHAFDVINTEFGRFFTLIFEGGTAKLEKVKITRKASAHEDEDDVDTEKQEKSYDTGIQIVVNPPKKKITNLAMLSGGERSLVSLALLFAIISYNPPPFAILDEVEAALDEANSRRFSVLLKELADKTQFVVVTHNRETMKEASMMYGITMGDDGISKLLSMKFDE